MFCGRFFMLHLIIVNSALNLELIKTFMIMESKRLVIIVLIVAFLLLIPLIAMQFTGEVNWTLSDFIVAGVLLLGTGLMLDLVMKKVKKTPVRITFIMIILVILLVIWAELAVGIF